MASRVINSSNTPTVGNLHVESRIQQRAMAYNNMAVRVYHNNNDGNAFETNGQRHACDPCFCPVTMVLRDHAWILCKGALELYLASQKKSSLTSDVAATATLSRCSPKALRYIQQAEHIYESYTAKFRNGQEVHEDETLPSDWDGPTHSVSGFRLHLFTTLHEIGNGTSLHDAGATIIFNLALLQHTKDPLSLHVFSLYRLGLSLLLEDNPQSNIPRGHDDASERVLHHHHHFYFLRIAMLNNTAVWFHENGDTVWAKHYLQQALACCRHVRDDTNVHCCCPLTSKQAQQNLLEENLQWIQRHCSSPAA